MPAVVYKTKSSKISGERYDAIVIGSGLGGLACAALLGKYGKKVLVLESHYVAGGFTHTFTRKNYEWDVGLHYVGEVHRPNSPLRKIFDVISEGNLDWAPMGDIYDRAIFQNGGGDDSYDFVSGTTKLIEKFKSYFPNEATAIDRYFNLVFEATGAAKGFFGARAMPPWLGNSLSPFLSRKFLKFSSATTQEVLSNLTSNQKLIGLLTTQFGDYGLPPSQSSFAVHAMVVKHYLDGGNYPVGGSGQIAETVIPVIERSGGLVAVKADVEKIILEKNKAVGVKLTNQDEIRAPIVISNAGVLNTFRRFLPAEAQPSFKTKLQKVQPSIPHLCIYLGLNGSSAELKLQKSNYWIFPTYDHDENIRRYVADPSAPPPVTYISFPSAKDPTWENHHPGRSTVEVIGFVPYERFRRWEETSWQKRGAEYEEIKQRLADKLLENVYRFLPQIKDKIEYKEISSPLSTRHFARYEQGEIYGLDHTPERFRQKWLRPHTPIKNLFLTGQDIVTVGIGGALFSGVLTASAILGKNVLMDVMKRKI